ISGKLNEKQLEEVVNTLMSGLKDDDYFVRKSYAKSLGVISTNSTDKQLEEVFNALPKEQQDCYFDSYEKALEEISTKWNEKQSKRVFNALIFFSKHSSNTNNDKDKDRRLMKLLGVISTNLTDKQLEGVFNALPNNLAYYYFKSYKKALEEISTKWNEKQTERAFNALIFVFKHSMDTNNDKDYYLVELLGIISTKLNDKQFYLLVIHLLERAKNKCELYVNRALSKISEDMWKRATICGLKENIQMKNENTLMNKENSNNYICKIDNDTNIRLLVFGLMTFNPCIQLNCDDNNTNFDALDELIRYCDKQAIKWKFPTQLKWNNISNDENEFKGYYTVIHEAARSGDLSQFKLTLQNHPDIDINDSCNEHRQTPLHLAINNGHWDIARYCIQKEAYIDIREGA
ncbi:hypothetical protein RFI_35185, partial [Reticulomyxa filosa]